jgi:hypothetical protein
MNNIFSTILSKTEEEKQYAYSEIDDATAHTSLHSTKTLYEILVEG